MTCNTYTPRTRRNRSSRYYQPHIGNLINEFFNTAVGDAVTPRSEKRTTNPAVNVIEYEDRYALQLAIPGLSKENVDIKYENEKLTVSSAKPEQESEYNYRLREFNYEGFTKHFRLPETVDTNSIKASFENGILTIEIGKKEEVIPQPPRKITIV